MNAEPSRRTGKSKPKPITKTRRGKEKDDFDWRSDPVKAIPTTSFLSGYKSAKHRWACKFKEQQRQDMLATANGVQDWGAVSLPNPFETVATLSVPQPNGNPPQPDPSTQAMEPHSPEISEVDEGALPGSTKGEAPGLDAPLVAEGGKDPGLPKWIRPSAIPKGKRVLTTKDKEEALKVATKKQRKQAAEELKSEHEERAKQVTAASLANESLQENVRNVEKQAEHELAQAAELDRGAQAASSLQREQHGREGPDPLKEFHSQIPGNSQGRNPGSIPELERPGSGNRKQQSKSQAKSGRQKQGDHKRKAGSSPDRRGNLQVPAEDTAETHGPSRKRGAQAESISPIASSKGQPQSPQAANGVSTAEDGSVLTQVMLVDGDEREHLGELDLHQLDSFKDLWRTMRAAYARLPKGTLKLVYKDVDNDLMQLQDEPWIYFKSIVRGLFLMKANTSKAS